VNQEERNHAKRLEQDCERLGTRTPRCEVEGCDETDPAALTGTFPNITCYEHLAERQGRSWTEGDHLAGQHNCPTEIVELPGNDHRAKSDLMTEWPDRTIRNPDQSPLIRAAATIRGWLEVLRIIIMRAVGWIPPFLERLDAWLTSRVGVTWWKDPGLGWEDA
jgi:hypothetical protein